MQCLHLFIYNHQQHQLILCMLTYEWLLFIICNGNKSFLPTASTLFPEIWIDIWKGFHNVKEDMSSQSKPSPEYLKGVYWIGCKVVPKMTFVSYFDLCLSSYEIWPYVVMNILVMVVSGKMFWEEIVSAKLQMQFKIFNRRRRKDVVSKCGKGAFHI